MEPDKYRFRSFGTSGIVGHHHWIYKFHNGYEASVIIGELTHGGGQGYFELAVRQAGRIVYDTPITDDVLGYLTFHEVVNALEAIKALPARKEEPAK